MNKPAHHHQPSAAYLQGVPQIPDHLARLMGTGRMPSDEDEEQLSAFIYGTICPAAQERAPLRSGHASEQPPAALARMVNTLYPLTRSERSHN